MSKYERVLITGGTGFLGKHLAIALNEKAEVVLTGRNNKQNFKAKSVTGCEVMPMDVSNIESVRDCVAEVNPDLIIHAAATKFVDLSEANKTTLAELLERYEREVSSKKRSTVDKYLIKNIMLYVY